MAINSLKQKIERGDIVLRFGTYGTPRIFIVCEIVENEPGKPRWTSMMCVEVSGFYGVVYNHETRKYVNTPDYVLNIRRTRTSNFNLKNKI